MARIKAIVCPLDWGLGHATRCVPLIRELQAQDYDVEAACSEVQRFFFARELPELTLLPSPGYQIRYPRHGWQMPFWLLHEYPRLRRLIHNEQHWIEALCESRGASLVISDNRFGCFSRKHPSIYITHQLRIAFPPPLHFLEWIGERWHASLRRNFRETWIPDFPQSPGLAGKLSHPPGPAELSIRYTGPLSRFEHSASLPSGAPEIDILAILSGPEPQRTLLEKCIFQTLQNIPGSHCVVRGKPEEHHNIAMTDGIRVCNHLSTPALVKHISNSRFVLCRPGYSTIMDLAQLGARPVMVPTPGQTEQIYLGRELQKNGYAFCLEQSRLNATSLQHAMQQNFHLPISDTSHHHLKNAVASLSAWF